jgi:hypothetical protein
MRGETLGETGPARVSITIGRGAASCRVLPLAVLLAAAAVPACASRLTSPGMPSSASACSCDSEGCSTGGRACILEGR